MFNAISLQLGIEAEAHSYTNSVELAIANMAGWLFSTLLGVCLLFFSMCVGVTNHDLFGLGNDPIRSCALIGLGCLPILYSVLAFSPEESGWSDFVSLCDLVQLTPDDFGMLSIRKQKNVIWQKLLELADQIYTMEVEERLSTRDISQALAGKRLQFQHCILAGKSLGYIEPGVRHRDFFPYI
jgi:hypothetical protein